MVPTSLTFWFVRTRLLGALFLVCVLAFASWKFDRGQIEALETRTALSATIFETLAGATEATLALDAARTARSGEAAMAAKADLMGVAVKLRRRAAEIETGLRHGLFSAETRALLAGDGADTAALVEEIATAATMLASAPDRLRPDMDAASRSARTAGARLVPILRDVMAAERRSLAADVGDYRAWRTVNLGIAFVLVAAIWGFIFIPLERHVQRTERAIRRRMDEAKAALRAKSDFLAMMSHEVRTPMNGVLGLTDQLARSELDAEQREIVRDLANSGDAVMTILGDVLDISRLESGRMTLVPRRTDLRTLVGTVRTMYAAEACQKGLELSVEFGGGLAAFHMVDPGRLRQVLANLVGNAVKFTARGHVTLSLSVERSLEARQDLIFEVEDSGIGIAPEDMHRIFGAFEQADTSTTRQYGGTGLGLAICHRVSDALGASLSVESELGRGSRFSLRLTLPTAQSPVSEETAAIEEEWDFSHLRLLVAEDNRVNRLLIGRLLRKTGCSPEFAEHGVAAVEAATATQFDLVLMDVSMPHLDGCGATRAILEADGRLGRDATPVVALTAHVDEGTRDRCIDSGMREVLGKPFQTDKILRAIATHARRPERTADVSAA